jgi:hypothetical protein
VKKKSLVNGNIDHVHSAAGNLIGYVLPRVVPGETHKFDSIYNAKGGKSSMATHNSVEDATAYLRALHDEDKKTAKPGEMQEQTRSKLAIIKEIIAELYIDEAKKPKKVRVKVKPQHWAAAKTLWGKRWGGMFHAKTPLSKIPREVEHEGKKITPWSRVVWQARTFAKNDAEKKTKDL